MHHHDYDHHSHVDPAFELVDSDCHQCGEHNAPHFNIECGHVHRIFGVNITHVPGDFIYWDSALELYVPAVEDKCDLMVLRVDRYGTWFEAANIGEFQLKNFTLKGAVYLNDAGELTNSETNTKIGFIENGHLYLSIQSKGEDVTPYVLPVATNSVLGGVKIGDSLEIDNSGVLDVNDAAFIQNQKANAQTGNAWIDGSFYSGEVIDMQGESSTVLGSYSISETIVSESRQTVDLIELQDKGLNSVFGSYNIAITKSILSSIIGSYAIAFGATNNTTNSERQSAINSSSSSILNANAAILLNAETSSIGFDAPNIYNSNRIGIFNCQDVHIVAGHDISVHDSYSVNIVPVDENISNSYAHVIASNTFTASGLDHVIIGAISGNLIQNAHWASIFSGYGIVAKNLESASLIGVVNSRVNANGTGTFISSALISAHDIDIEADSYIGWSLIFGQTTKFTNSKWTYSLIGGRAHVLANTLGTSPNNDSNLVVGIGHNLESIGYSSISGYQNRVRGAQASIIGGYICDIENSQYNLIVGENSTYENIHDSILAGASSTVTHTTRSAGNIVVGDHHTITESQNVLVSGGTNVVSDSNYSMVVGSTNNASGLLNSIISGFGNTLADSNSGILLSGSNNTVNGIANGILMLAGNSNTITNSSGPIFGDSNTATGSDNILVNGENHNLTNSDYALINGYAITVNGTSNYALLASGNSFTLQNSSGAVFGYGHNIGSADCVLVTGYNNKLASGDYAFLSGYDVNVAGRAFSSFIGGSEIVVNSDANIAESLIYGRRLTMSGNISDSIIVARDIVSLGAVKYSAVFGYTHNTIAGDGNIVAGESHVSTGGHNAVFGYNNESVGTQSLIFGADNITSVNGSLVGGFDNTVTGTANSLIIGDNATVANSSGVLMISASASVTLSDKATVLGSQQSGIVGEVTGIRCNSILGSEQVTITNSTRSGILGSSSGGVGTAGTLVSGGYGGGSYYDVDESESLFIIGSSFTSIALGYRASILSSRYITNKNGFNSSIIASDTITTNLEFQHSVILGARNTTINGNVYDSIISSNSSTQAIFSGDVSQSFIKSVDSSFGIVSNSLILAQSLTSTGAITSSLINGLSHSVGLNFNYSILTGSSNIVGDECYGVAVFGVENSVLSASSRSLVSGYRNKLEINSYYSAILGGTGNTLSDSAYAAAIIGGQDNSNTGGYYSTILGGFGNTITQSTYSSILGGYQNALQSSSRYSAIIGGSGNVIGSSVNYSVVLGGLSNQIGNSAICSTVAGEHSTSNHDYQFVVGRYNANAADSIFEIGWGTNLASKTVFRVTTEGISEQVGLILKPQASNPSTIVDGQMFSKADGLYVQIGGVLYKVNLTPA